MPLPQLNQLQITPPQPVSAQLNVMGVQDEMRRTDIAADRNTIVREQLGLSKEQFEFNKAKATFVSSRDFVGGMDRNEVSEYKDWLSKIPIFGELADLLPDQNELFEMSEDEFMSMKEKIRIGTDNLAKMERIQLEETLKLAREEKKRQTDMEDYKEKERFKASLKGDDPKTLVAAWLKKNPDATNEEIIAFGQSIKGKGFEMTLPDGTKFSLGGPRATTSSKSVLEKEISEMSSELMELGEIKSTSFEEALTYQGKAWNLVLNTLDKLNFDVGVKNKDFIGSARVFTENLEQFFNKYRKRITGAQAAMKEIQMLRTSILNKEVGPTQFRSSLKSIIGKVQKGIRLKRMILSRGPMDENVLNDLMATGVDVPDEELDRRGDELFASGLSKEQVKEQLRREGYRMDKEVGNAE